MKVTRERVARAGLKLLDDVGLEALTLRVLARSLEIQAGAMYWHFENKQELLDEMASIVLGEGARHLVPRRESADWETWATAFGNGLRKTLLAYRDGARMVSGTRLTNTEYMQVMERIAAKMTGSGFTVRQAVVLLSTIYNYTLSFVMEEQAVFPRPGERSPLYDLEARDARLAAADLPLLRQSGPILFDRFDRRFREGLELIVRGAKPRGEEE